MAIGGVLFDIDGVLVTSWKPIAGASKTLRTLSDNQIACSYLTNTTTRTRVQIAELLTEAGMAVRADEVITAAVLTAQYVRNRYPDARCFLVDRGMYLIGMEETSGRKATAVGKPAPEGFLAAASRLGVDPDEMYMIGDDLNNDVLAAQVVGMTGVLVRTGKFRQDTLDRWAADEFAMQPNHVIDSVADLPEVLGL